MKKLSTLMILLAFTGGLWAQSFSDDFESYNVGDYVGAQNPAWSTWSGTTGGSEDAQVSSNQANSGTKSIYFVSTSANGGPQDVVLDFGGEHNVGQFTFMSSFYIVSGKGGYFNFQSNTTIGLIWALDCYFVNDGNIYLASAGDIMIQSTFTPGTWFDFRIEANLSTNEWELFIDDVSQGTWANTNNQVASIDIYPVNPTSMGGNSQSGFYVDDVSYEVVPYTLPATNGAVTLIAPFSGLANQTAFAEVTVRNLGTTTITSYDLTLDYNGEQITENITGTNLASLATQVRTFAAPITLAVGSNNCTVTISNVNGGADDDANDDVKVVIVDPVVPAPGKMVVGEEGTGTWCGWCVRGHVYMEYLSDKYDGYWAGVAVHNGDPMTDTDYDTGISPYISGYPGGMVDRGAEIDPSEFEADFLERIVIAPTAFITNGANYNSTSGLLDISMTVDWQTAASGNWSVACIIVEDNVTGTTSGYDQSNSYSGGGSGIMGGYEALPNPVPAAQMNYRHVGRKILPDFTGASDVFPGSVSGGETYTFNFALALDQAWDDQEIHIITILMNPSGDVDNAMSVTLDEAVTNGYVDGVGLVGATEIAAVDDLISIYPNPTSGFTFVNLNMESKEDVSLKLINMNGQVVTGRSYGQLSGGNQLPIDTRNLAKGIYTVQIQIGNQMQNERLVVE